MKNYSKIIKLFSILIICHLLIPMISSNPIEHRFNNTSICKTEVAFNDINNINSKLQKSIDSELIEEFTWSVMRYDHLGESANFGVVNMPTPTPGTILVPTDMMSIGVCRAALSIYHEDKMETLKALEEYDIKNMLFRPLSMIWTLFSDSNSLPTSYRPKANAHEMSSLGEICFRGNFVGDCYSQTSFNTAVLRLCGFSADEVFGLNMPGHAVNIVRIQDDWYVFDSVQAQFSNKAIYETYHPPVLDMIFWIENDKYFINFGVDYPEAWPYLHSPFSNIDNDTLIDIVEHIVPMFNDSDLGMSNWDIYEFIENATPCPEITSIEIPYCVKDAVGSTVKEKAQSLVALNKAFIYNQTGGDIPNQYDRSLYSFGLLSVEYPQAYSNAAKFAEWTSWFATCFDTGTASNDCFMTSFWIRSNIINSQIMPLGCVAFSDFPYFRRGGSSLDQAIMAYGTLRNMKKENDFWCADDLFVLVTEDYEGYLAVNLNDNWQYFSFDQGPMNDNTAPSNIKMVFNEVEYFDSWDQ
jgi:hypothetical protein